MPGSAPPPQAVPQPRIAIRNERTRGRYDPDHTIRGVTAPNMVAKLYGALVYREYGDDPLWKILKDAYLLGESREEVLTA